MHPLRIVVIGNGMPGQRFLERLIHACDGPDWSIVVFGDEPRPAYDRVALSSWFRGVPAEDLAIPEPGFFEENGIDLRLGARITGIDDVIVHLSVADTDSLRHLVLEGISSIEGVVDERTSLVFEYRQKKVVALLGT